MKLAKGASKRLKAAGHRTASVRDLLERLESCTPHLTFHEWRAAKTVAGPVRGNAVWKAQARTRIEVALEAPHLRLATTCRRDAGAISLDDHRFLGALASEAAHALSSARNGTISLVDFGSSAVAREIQGLPGLAFDPLPVLQFVRALGQETYENQRLAYGLILTSGTGGTALLASAFDNKRFKRLTDGFSTALVLDRHGAVVELAELTIPKDEGTARQRRPWWASALAVEAKDRDGVGVALTRNGDILVLHGGRLVFTQRAGKWRKWDHPAILRKLKRLWDFRGTPLEIDRVLTYLYHVALDLAFRRSGGLLVVVGSQKKFRKLLSSRKDAVGSHKNLPESALDVSVAARAVFRTDRRVIGDLASLDGALLVDRAGAILAYGAMTSTSRSAQQGARTRAASAAGRVGVAIKVSSDGDISFFRSGSTAVFEI